MITPADLTTLSRQDLAELAKQSGVAEYRTLKKPDLIAAIRKSTQSAKTKAKGSPSVAASSKTKAKPTEPKASSGEKPSSVEKVVSQRQTSSTATKVADAKTVGAKAGKSKTDAVAAKRPTATAKPAQAKPKSDKAKSDQSKTDKAVAAKSAAASPSTALPTAPRASKAPAEKAAASKAATSQASNKAPKSESKPGKAVASAPGRSENAKGNLTAKADAASPRRPEKAKAQTATPANTSRTVRPLQAVASPETSAAETASFPKRKLASAPATSSDRIASAKKSDPATAGKPEHREPTPAKSTAKKSVPVTPKAPAANKASVKPPVVKKPVAPPAPPISAKSARIRREMALRSARAAQNKDISTDVLIAGSAVRTSGTANGHSPHKDRVVLLVRDCYWLQADWEITRAAVDRVRVAMAEKWHNSIPILRLMSVADAAANRAEQIVRDIPIHGGVSSWYIDVDEPPSRYRVIIGYVADNERFFPICRSNVVETPRPGAANQIDEHWRDIAEDYERIYSLSGGLDSTGGSDDLKELFEDRLKRTMPTRADSSTAGSETDAALDRHRSLPFEVDAELIIYGSTVPGATVMLGGEPVKLRPDGSFTIRVALPDKRQVFPVVAQSRDGMRQRTTVVAVERNTKVMEAVDRDSNF